MMLDYTNFNSFHYLVLFGGIENASSPVYSNAVSSTDFAIKCEFYVCASPFIHFFLQLLSQVKVMIGVSKVKSTE